MASFGRYEILDKLGEGAMGVVYRARDGALGRVVALKMLSAELGAEEELQKRFRAEVEAVGRLNHPNVVTVYDVGESEGRLYMAMELLEGEDLRTLIERHVEVRLPDKVGILIQICQGLGYAHSKGVVHRDIKPANILVTSSARVKILDFGLARVATRPTITRRGVILGTPDYMSPEQAVGKTLDHRTDVFSAGSVFYEFLTLQKPFRGKTLHSVLYQILSEHPIPVLTLNPELPARLAAIVHRMLHKDADRRYPTMEDVGSALRPLYSALRASRGRSAFPGALPTAGGEETRLRVRDHLTRGRADIEAGRFARAADEMELALSLDPDCDEAVELLWRAGQPRRATRAQPAPPPDPAVASRIEALLRQAARGQPEEQARRALYELALIAPDDPRVSELVAERAGPGPDAGEPSEPADR